MHEDDAATSAFYTLCRGLQDGRFTAISDRDDLWKLLVVITARKVSYRLRSDGRQKRGGDHNIISMFAGSAQSGTAIEVAGREPTPEFAAEVAETYDLLFDQLPETLMKDIASKKMEGDSIADIAAQLNVGRRTVERKLSLIRSLWSRIITEEAAGDDTE